MLGGLLCLGVLMVFTSYCLVLWVNTYGFVCGLLLGFGYVIVLLYVQFVDVCCLFAGLAGFVAVCFFDCGYCGDFVNSVG